MNPELARTLKQGLITGGALAAPPLAYLVYKEIQHHRQAKAQANVEKQASAGSDVTSKRVLAFEYGVDCFCKKAGFDADDTAAMYRLIKLAYGRLGWNGTDSSLNVPFSQDTWGHALQSRFNPFSDAYQSLYDLTKSQQIRDWQQHPSPELIQQSRGGHTAADLLIQRAMQGEDLTPKEWSQIPKGNMVDIRAERGKRAKETTVNEYLKLRDEVGLNENAARQQAASKFPGGSDHLKSYFAEQAAQQPRPAQGGPAGPGMTEGVEAIFNRARTQQAPQASVPGGASSVPAPGAVPGAAPANAPGGQATPTPAPSAPAPAAPVPPVSPVPPAPVPPAPAGPAQGKANPYSIPDMGLKGSWESGSGRSPSGSADLASQTSSQSAPPPPEGIGLNDPVGHGSGGGSEGAVAASRPEPPPPPAGATTNLGHSNKAPGVYGPEGLPIASTMAPKGTAWAKLSSGA